jgi:Raf kinase inhibitor-like YbhB/YbcL family protein
MAQPQSPHLTTHSSGERLTLQKVTPNEHAGMGLTSPGVEDDGRLADLHSAWHDNVSPALSWTMRPEAEAYALIVEDPDAPTPQPFLHWMIWNIPGAATGLPRGVSSQPHPTVAKGAVQGRNGAGKTGYYGPRPPEGHGVHRYHFQLFALDKRLPDDPNLSREELTDMLKAHTLVDAELVATYEQPEPPPRGRDAGTYA